MSKIEMVELKIQLLNWRETLARNHGLTLGMPETWKLYSMISNAAVLVEENLTGGN